MTNDVVIKHWSSPASRQSNGTCSNKSRTSQFAGPGERQLPRHMVPLKPSVGICIESKRMTN